MGFGLHIPFGSIILGFPNEFRIIESSFVSIVACRRTIIEFSQVHDELAEKIAERGYKFIKANLRLSHVSCYWKELLTKYASLIKYSIEPRSDLVLISLR